MNSQAIQGEQVVDPGDVLRVVGDQVGQASGGDHRWRRIELLKNAREDAVHQPDIAVEDAALQICNSVGANYLWPAS
jgi:hypothetical protein